VLDVDCRFSVDAAEALVWYEGTGFRVGFRRRPPTLVDVLRLMGSAEYGLEGLVGLVGLVGAARASFTAVGVDGLLLLAPAYALRSADRCRECPDAAVAVVAVLLFAAAVLSFARATARVLELFDCLRARRSGLLACGAYSRGGTVSMYSDRRRPARGFCASDAVVSSDEESEYLPCPALLSVGAAIIPIESACGYEREPER